MTPLMALLGANTTWDELVLRCGGGAAGPAVLELSRRGTLPYLVLEQAVASLSCYLTALMRCLPPLSPSAPPSASPSLQPPTAGAGTPTPTPTPTAPAAPPSSHPLLALLPALQPSAAPEVAAALALLTAAAASTAAPAPPAATTNPSASEVAGAGVSLRARADALKSLALGPLLAGLRHGFAPPLSRTPHLQLPLFALAAQAAASLARGHSAAWHRCVDALDSAVRSAPLQELPARAPALARAVALLAGTPHYMGHAPCGAAAAAQSCARLLALLQTLVLRHAQALQMFHDGPAGTGAGEGEMKGGGEGDEDNEYVKVVSTADGEEVRRECAVFVCMPFF